MRAFDIIALAAGLVKIIIGVVWRNWWVAPHHPGIATLAAGELAMTTQPNPSQSSHAPASFLAMVATWRPWNLAMASSFSLGRRLPSAPAIVEAP